MDNMHSTGVVHLKFTKYGVCYQVKLFHFWRLNNRTGDQ